MRANPSAAVAKVEIFRDPCEAIPIWRALAPERLGSFYQSESFVLNWLRIYGAAVEPFFIVARDASGAPAALLPLGVFRYGPLRVAQFLGGREANYNLGLFRDPQMFAAADLRALLCAAARAPNGPHVYRLLSLPKFWNGVENPLTRLPHQPCASPAYCTALMDDGEALLAQKLSADTRKKLRKKEKRLCELGALHHVRADAPEQAEALLDLYFAQKQHNYSLGDSGDQAALRRFYSLLATEKLELHALTLSDRPIAILAAALNGARLQGLFNSFDPDLEIAKNSPGDLLLTRILRDACARGLQTFDLGLGEARYKQMFCGQREDMADLLFAPGLAGALAKSAFALALATKAAIKNNPALWRAIRDFRRRAARNRAGAAGGIVLDRQDEAL